MNCFVFFFFFLRSKKQNKRPPPSKREQEKTLQKTKGDQQKIKEKNKTKRKKEEEEGPERWRWSYIYCRGSLRVGKCNCNKWDISRCTRNPANTEVLNSCWLLATLGWSSAIISGEHRAFSTWRIIFSLTINIFLYTFLGNNRQLTKKKKPENNKRIQNPPGEKNKQTKILIHLELNRHYNQAQCVRKKIIWICNSSAQVVT